MSDLKPLYARREKKCLDFSLKCIKHPKNSRLFPLNPNLFLENHDLRKRELFKVNFSMTDTYKKSAIPF